MDRPIISFGNSGDDEKRRTSTVRKIDMIRQRLEDELQPLQIRILDESLHHAGHVGANPEGESHLRLEIVSRKFEGLSRVARHRLVYKALGNAFDEGLHALKIEAKAPGE
jgi:BolA family transcriptional regulator, general stress-responsive regulator